MYLLILGITRVSQMWVMGGKLDFSLIYCNSLIYITLRHSLGIKKAPQMGA